MDLAPTALWLFGIRVPAHMDGKVLFRDEGSGVEEVAAEPWDVPATEEKVRARA